MKILSSFTLMSFQTYTTFFVTKEDILKNVDKKIVLVPIDFHYIFWPYNVSQWKPKLFGYQHFSFLLWRRNKVIEDGFTWGWVNDDRNFILGCIIPLIGFVAKLKFS